MSEVTAIYNPAVFTVRNLDDAKRIILTRAPDMSTEDRWVLETPYLVRLIRQHIHLTEKSVVLDFGCGVGRIAKQLIAETGCIVIGADISPSMRGLASNYVGTDRFCAVPPEMLETLGVKFDAAIAIWALQHCLLLEKDLEKLAGIPSIFVVGGKTRFIPVRNAAGDWMNDGKDVRGLMKEKFTETDGGELEAAFTGSVYAEESYWALYRERKD